MDLSLRIDSSFPLGEHLEYSRLASLAGFFIDGQVIPGAPKGWGMRRNPLSACPAERTRDTENPPVKAGFFLNHKESNAVNSFLVTCFCPRIAAYHCHSNGKK